MGLRDKIVTADGRKEKRVWVPEWDAQVVIREMSAGESIDLANLEADDGAPVARVLIISLYEDGGERVFRDDDEELVLSQPTSVVVNLLEAVKDLNGRDEDAVDEAKKG